MKTRSFALLTLSVAILLSSVASAQDAEKKGRRNGRGNRQAAGAMLMKKLEAVELTDQQQAKIKDLTAAMQTGMKELREAGLTQEITRKRTELTKGLREEKKGQKAIKEAVAAAFTDEQVKMLEKSSKLNLDFRKGVYALLTKDQVAKLPADLQKQIETALQPKKAAGQRRGKGKGKKAADAS